MTKSNKQAGVYRIYNISNNKSYIGSTSNLDRRIKTHKQHLLKQCHNCRVLQNDYNIEPNNIRYDIIEIVEEDSMYLLRAYEKYYMYKYDSITINKGYNEKLATSDNNLLREVYNIKQNK